MQPGMGCARQGHPRRLAQAALRADSGLLASRPRVEHAAFRQPEWWAWSDYAPWALHSEIL